MDRKLVYFFSFLFLFVGIRFFLFSLYAPRLVDGQDISFVTTILDEPKNQGYRVQFPVFYGSLFGKQRILVNANANQQFFYGEVVRISGHVSSNKNMRVLNKNNVIYALNAPKIETNYAQENFLLAVTNFIRQKVKHEYFSVLSQTQANLLFGILFGIKGDFAKDFIQDLQTGGVLHVIAASGMNITLIASVIFSLANYFLKRQIALACTFFSICFYTLIAGFQPSIVRAAVMTLFAFAGQILGRQYSGLYGLFLAAVLLVLWNPPLLYDVGFQLSVSATLGILVIKPLFPRINVLEDLSTTCAAQLATLPILLAAFGTYSLLSILVNFLVLWTIPPLMVLGGIGAILSFFFLPLSEFFLWLCVPLLWFFETVVRFFGGFVLSLQLREIPVILILGYYILLCSAVLLIPKKIKAQRR